MNEFRFSERSWKNLTGIDPRLVAVAALGLKLSTVDFAVVEGLRTLERQRRMVATGKSKTLKSKHITGDAFDVMAYANGKATYAWAPYEEIAIAIKEAARQLRVPIAWGGDWRTFKDGVHFELKPRFEVLP